MSLFLTSQPLLRDEQDKLRVLLNSPAFNTLKKVIETKALEQEVDCANHIGQSAKFEKFNEAALKAQEAARPFRDTLNVLEEIAKSPIHNTIKQINPTPL